MTANQRVQDPTDTGIPRSHHLSSIRPRRITAFAVASVVAAATLIVGAPFAPAVADPCNAIDPGAALAPSSSTTCVHSFAASGSWTVPVGVTSVDVLAVGGGGGGGGSYWESAFYFGAGAGGGGGQVKTQGSNSVTAGSSLTIVIGTGGAGGPAQTTSAAGTGTRGGTTSMTNGTWTASAAGGKGGANAQQAESLSGGNNGGNDQSPSSGGAGNSGAGSYSWPSPSGAVPGNVVGAGGGGGGATAAGSGATRSIPSPLTFGTSAGGNGGAGSNQASNYAAGILGIGGGGGAISQGASANGVATAGSGDTVRSSGTGGTTTVNRSVTPVAYAATASLDGSTNTGGGGGGAALAISGSSVASAAGATGGSGLVVVRYSPSVAFSDTTLSSLALSAGSLTPAFASGTTSYTASASYAVASTTVTPTVAQPSSTVTVNGTTVVSGSASSSIPLTVGTNTVTVVVTAQNASTRTYTVTVTRGAAATNATLSNLALAAGSLSPSFSSGTTSYASSVVNASASTTVTPTVADANATVTVNGTTVASAATSAAISLAEGSNMITVLVTAEDGTTTQAYSVTVTRASAGGGGSGSGGGGSSAPAPTSTTETPASLIVTPSGPLQPVIEAATMSVSPGSAVVLVGGVPTTSTVAPTSRRDGVQVSGDGWTLDLAGTLPNGTPAPLDTNGTMRVVQGNGLAASGAGFAPNTEASIYVFPASPTRSAVRSSREGSNVPESAPLLLGNLTVGIDGTFAGTVPVPDTLSPGDFVAQVNGYTPAFQVRSASVGLIVTAERTRVVRKVRTTITFAAESSALGSVATARLARLVRSLPRGATRVTIQSIGYVQPSQNTSNDISLSTARAKNAMLAMRSDGLRGQAYVSGRGQAPEPGPVGRRVVVVVAYTLT